MDGNGQYTADAQIAFILPAGRLVASAFSRSLPVSSGQVMSFLCRTAALPELSPHASVCLIQPSVHHT